MSRLVEFYRGAAADSEGRTLANLWAFSDDEMESVHDFIQWLFPLREPSGFNPDAPLVSEADVVAFRDDPMLRAHLLRSFDRFLAFLGLGREGGRVVERPDYARKRSILLHPNHNWLRITRVLASTRMLGLPDASRAFLDFLVARRDAGTIRVAPETFRYWDRAASGD